MAERDLPFLRPAILNLVPAAEICSGRRAAAAPECDPPAGDFGAHGAVDSAAGCGGLARLLALDLGRHGGGERGRVHRVSAPARAAGCMHASNLSYIYERERNPWERPCPAGESCPASLRVAMRSPLPFPCVPYRPSLGPCGFPFSPASVEEPTAQIPCFAPLVGRGAPYGHLNHRLNLTVRSVAQMASNACSAGVLHLSGQVCCNATCGMCGGHLCSSRPGGPNQCCMPAIMRTGRRVCKSSAEVVCILRDAAARAALETQPTTKPARSSHSHDQGIDTLHVWFSVCGSKLLAETVLSNIRALVFMASATVHVHIMHDGAEAVHLHLLKQASECEHEGGVSALHAFRRFDGITV